MVLAFIELIFLEWRWKMYNTYVVKLSGPLDGVMSYGGKKVED